MSYAYNGSPNSGGDGGSFLPNAPGPQYDENGFPRKQQQAPQQQQQQDEFSQQGPPSAQPDQPQSYVPTDYAYGGPAAAAQQVLPYDQNNDDAAQQIALQPQQMMVPPPHQHPFVSPTVGVGAGKTQTASLSSPDFSNTNDGYSVGKGASFVTQLVSTMRRQFIQKRRMWTSWLLEILLPGLFVVGLLAISLASSSTDYPPQNLVSPIGPLLLGSEVRDSWLCYDPLNNKTHADFKLLLSPCNTSAAYTPIPKSREVPIEGLAINGTLETAFRIAYLLLDIEKDMEIPNFDEYVLFKWMAVAVLPAPDNLFMERIGRARQPGKLFISPSGPTGQALSTYLNETFVMYKHVFGGFFPSRDAAIPFIKSLDNEGDVWALYDVVENKPEHLSYTLSMNTSAMSMLRLGSREDFAVGLGEKWYSSYIVSGALTLQKTINDYHALTTMPLNTLNRSYSAGTIFATGRRSHLTVAPMPLDSYTKDEFLQTAGSMAAFLLVLAFLYPVSQLAKRLVEEKEQRLREGTMIMGLTKGAFFTSWLLVYYIQMIVTSLIMAIIMKVGVTTKTDFFVIWITYLCFSLTSVNMSALLSTWFNRSKIAALCVPLLYFVFAIPAFALPETTEPAAYHLLSIFFCPMPFSVSLKLIFNHEINRGFGWNMAGSTKDRPYNYGLCLWWYVFEFVAYLILVVYLDNVLPKEWGTTLHPCFCCPCCGCLEKRNRKKKRQLNAANAVTGNSFSPDSSPMSPVFSKPDNAKNHIKNVPKHGVMQDYPMLNNQSTVHIQQLRKEFPGAHGKINVAVDGMELRMFPDGITVFLGHNGAGKTTVMNMMTGMMSPTDGDVTIYGNSILNNMQAIRRDIGFCPQHNILWDELTCMEHLQYFARLKGYSGDEVDKEALELLHKVDLLDKKDVFSKNLSGGQKRKLSVAIAFMGKARLVLLDEPTAGMDVAARRHTWDVLKDMAKGRTILLTTHYMDEADLLGSRIAIMSKGALHSYGTPMYLKNNLGSGYVMRIALTRTITDFSFLLGEVQRILPSASIREAKGQEVSIALPKNDVRKFPAAIRAMDDPATKERLSVASVSVSVSSLEDVFLSIAEQEEAEGKSVEEVKAEADRHAAAFEALEKVYVRLQKSQRESAAENYAHNVEMQGVVNPPIPNAHANLSMGRTGGFKRQLKGMFMKRVNHGRRDYCALCLQILAPLICILIAMGLGELQAPSPKRYYWTNDDLYGSVDQTISTDNCDEINAFIDPSFAIVDKQHIPTTYNFSAYLLEQYNNNGDNERMISISCNDSRGDNVLLANATGLASAPQAVNEFYNAKLKASMSPIVSAITAAQWPFPFSERQQTQIDTIGAVLMALFILIPFTFVPSTYVAFVVRERQCKSKHLQFVSGASYSAYWLANFLFDLISFCVTVLIAFIIFIVFEQNWVIGDGEKAFGAVILFLLYGVSAIGFAYLVSFLFDNHSSAQTVVMMVNFIVGFLLVLVMFFLREIESTSSTADVLVFIFRVAPPFALGDGLFQMVMANALEAVNGKKSPFAMEVAGWCMLYMGLLSGVFLGITMWIDHPNRNQRKEMMGFKADKLAPAVANEDEDVARERFLVESGKRPTDVVQVQGLRKEFHIPGGKHKVAVQNITFGVKPGEVFGFLGTNGAGKTTTMSMLTTEILPTCGHGRIGGFDIVHDAATTRRLIGYCPQFDAIMDLLTPAEHLRLFSSLRGIDPGMVEEVVDALIDSCALNMYRDIPAGSLSGGNKRKLSVAMALIGGPSIVFLDEPSAGMDPHARRSLWDVVIFVAKHSSVVLTTHHLEEVDVLAHRVGIMDAGLMKCLGTLEHLKMKFGNGFELTVQVSEGSQSTAAEFIQSTYPDAVQVEARQARILYTLPFESTDLASLFETIQRATDEGRVGILDYTVQQTSLEQVFMRISELAEHGDGSPFDPASPSAAAAVVANRNVPEGVTSTSSNDVPDRRQTSDVYADAVFGGSRTRRTVTN